MSFTENRKPVPTPATEVESYTVNLTPKQMAVLTVLAGNMIGGSEETYATLCQPLEGRNIRYWTLHFSGIGKGINPKVDVDHPDFLKLVDYFRHEKTGA